MKTIIERKINESEKKALLEIGATYRTRRDGYTVVRHDDYTGNALYNIVEQA